MKRKNKFGTVGVLFGWPNTVKRKENIYKKQEYLSRHDSLDELYKKEKKRRKRKKVSNHQKRKQTKVGCPDERKK